MKQQKKKTRKQKQAEHKTPENHKRARREKARREEAQRLNREINRVASSILKNTKDLDPKFSKTVDENFWDLI